MTDRIQAFIHAPAPTNVSGMREILGGLAMLRRFDHLIAEKTDTYCLQVPQVFRDEILNHKKRTSGRLFHTETVQKVFDGHSFPRDD